MQNGSKDLVGPGLPPISRNRTAQAEGFHLHTTPIALSAHYTDLVKSVTTTGDGSIITLYVPADLPERTVWVFIEGDNETAGEGIEGAIRFKLNKSIITELPILLANGKAGFSFAIATGAIASGVGRGYPVDSIQFGVSNETYIIAPQYITLQCDEVELFLQRNIRSATKYMALAVRSETLH